VTVTAKFPTSILADADIGGEVRDFQTLHLAGDHSSTATTLTCLEAIPADWPASGEVTLGGSERVQYAGKGSFTLTGCTRAYDAPANGAGAAQNWPDGTTVEMTFGAHQFNQLFRDLAATQTKLGTGAATPANGQALVGNGSGTSTWRALTAADVSAGTFSGAFTFASPPVLGTLDGYVKAAAGTLSGQSGVPYTDLTYSGLTAGQALMASGATAASFRALTAADIASGTFADARIAQSNVTQHQAALSIAETQIVDGSLLARLGSSEVITGNWQYKNRVDFYRTKNTVDMIIGDPADAGGAPATDVFAAISFQANGVKHAQWQWLPTKGNGTFKMQGSFLSPDQMANNQPVDFWLSGGGNFVIGDATRATNATSGFLYLPTMNGTPTGVPTAWTGTVAFIYDTSGNKLWVYNGAWRSVTLA
jgi:hypothetical protein